MNAGLRQFQPGTASGLSRRVWPAAGTTVLVLLSLVALAPAAFPFTIGDLYLLTNVAAGGAPAILRVDPLSGAVTTLVDLEGELAGTFTYDRWRDRLIFVMKNTNQMRAVDDAGVVTDFDPALLAPGLVAARGDGIIYRWNTSLYGFQYIDAADQVHDLLDEGGGGRFGFPVATKLDELTYDPATNSLICFQGTYNGVNIAECGDPTMSCAVRVPLTDEGTRVAGPLSAAQAAISLSYVRIVGAGPAPGGLVWTVDSNTNYEEPRLQFLDTAAMTCTPFAWVGPFDGAGTINGGTYSNVRSQGILVDTYEDVLRAFAVGEHGEGTAFAAGISGPLWNETTRLLEVSGGLSDVLQETGRGVGWGLLAAPSPNPFSNSTSLNLVLPASAQLHVAVYDAAGRLVRRLADQTWNAGAQAVAWDGRDDRHRKVPSGTYFVTVTGPHVAAPAVRKVVVVR